MFQPLFWLFQEKFCDKMYFEEHSFSLTRT